MDKIIIPENEYNLTFSRSSSKGGQNVDKVSTKVTLRWNVNNSTALNESQKRQIFENLGNKIDKESNLILYSQSERHQFRNREEVIEKFNELINKALKPLKKRVPTKPTRGSVNRRLKEKKERSEKKKLRKINND
ncbi:MAG: aminoacyl-tRNA hydrolase [Parcubacteria group bacterium]|nr:aminoacyl-tRNA hydrolase [Parcubacteria group bacterium]